MNARSCSTWLFVCLLATYAAFPQEPGPNENARLALTAAIARHGTLSIDGVLSETPAAVTGDWSFKGGRLYSNKAPGLSIAAAPVWWTLEKVEGAFGISRGADATWIANAWVVNLLFNASLSALAASVFGGVATSLARADVRAPAAVALGASTLVFPYATTFFSHAGSGALLFIAFAIARDEARGERRPARLALAGLLAGIAGASEYAVAVPAALLAGWILAVTRSARAALAFSAGGAPALAGLMAYHHACFGSPFTTAIAFVNPKFRDPALAGGILGGPSPAALWGLTFSTYRGLFLYSPVLLVAFVGLARLARRDGRAEAILAALVFAWFLGLTSSFNGWHGGRVQGPRYLVPAIPFVALGLAEPLVRWRRLVLALVALGATVGVVVAATSVTIRAVQIYDFPLRDYALRSFLFGDVGPRWWWIRPGLALVVLPVGLWIAFARKLAVAEATA